jgi:hypothetical protein
LEEDYSLLDEGLYVDPLRLDRAWNNSRFLDDPRALAVVGNTLYICDCDNHRVLATDIRTLDKPYPVLSAENASVTLPNGSSKKYKFTQPLSLFTGPDGSLYITCFQVNKLLKWNAGKLSVVAAHTNFGLADFPLELSAPHSGFVHPKTGSIYLADGGNNLIRILTTGETSTSIGTGVEDTIDGSFKSCSLARPYALAYCRGWDVGFCSQYSCIRGINIKTQEVDTWVGNLNAGFADGVGSKAKFQFIRNIECTDDGTIIVADEENKRIRLVTPDRRVSTIYGPTPVALSGIALTPYGDLIFSISRSHHLGILENVIQVVQDAFDLSALKDFAMGASDEAFVTEISGICVNQKLVSAAYPFLNQNDFCQELNHLIAKASLPASEIIDYLYSNTSTLSLHTTLALLYMFHKHKAPQYLQSQIGYLLSKSLNYLSRQELPLLLEFTKEHLEASELLSSLIYSAMLARGLKTNAELEKFPPPYFPFSKQTYLSVSLSELYTNSRGIQPGYTLNFNLLAHGSASGVRCHDWVLFSRWAYFRNFVLYGGSDFQSGVLEFPEATLSQPAIDALVEYLYTNDLPSFSEQSSLAVIGQLRTHAEQFGLQSMAEPGTPAPGFEALFRKLKQLEGPPK